MLFQFASASQNLANGLSVPTTTSVTTAPIDVQEENIV